LSWRWGFTRRDGRPPEHHEKGLPLSLHPHAIWPDLGDPEGADGVPLAEKSRSPNEARFLYQGEPDALIHHHRSVELKGRRGVLG
jgi:hypothetical protein